MGGIHGIELMLLRDVGMKASVIIHKTETLKRLLSPEAIEEVQNITLGWARKYGSDPEILINSAFDEEIETI